MQPARPAGLTGILIVFALLAATPARAEITQKDLDLFIENSASDNTGPGDVINVEDVLHLAARRGRTPQRAIEIYAGARNISTDHARLEAEFIVALLDHWHRCESRNKALSCGLAKNPEWLARIRKAGFEDRSGQLLQVAGLHFARIRKYYSPASRKDLAKFLEMVEGHPAFDSIMLGIFSDRHEVEFLVPLLARRAPHPFAVMEIAAGDYEGTVGQNDLALIAYTRRRLMQGQGNGESRLLITRALIAGLLQAAQVDEAVGIYLNEPDREELWRLPNPPVNPARRQGLDRVFAELYEHVPAKERVRHAETLYRSRIVARHRRKIAETKLNLAAALVASGSRAEALQLLAGLSISELKRLGLEGRQRIYFLREVIKRQFDDDDIFRIFLNEGDEEAYPDWPPLIGDTLAMATGKTPGWLRVLRWSQWAFRDLAFNYLSDAGYDEMALSLVSGSVLDDDPGEDERRKTGVYEFYSDRLGKSFFRQAEQYKDRVTAIENERMARVRALVKDRLPTPAHVTGRPVLFEERRLPKGIAPFVAPKDGTKNKHGDDGGVPKDLRLPVAPDKAVRLEKIGDEYVLIFISTALDPVVKVSPGGYWVTKSRAGGRDWETPVYLGLQRFSPYVVVPKSNLPLMNGNVLQIEVQRREVEPEHTTFKCPPFFLNEKRRQDGLYLRLEWDRLTRDEDADSLTDLVEQRMGLDPYNPDTDGDGLHDGLDSLPLTPFRPRKPEENELAVAILGQVLGYERAAVVTGDVDPRAGQGLEGTTKSTRRPRPAINPLHTRFLVADPGNFTGIRLPRRLLVYGFDAAEKMDRQFDFFCPARVNWVFTNRSSTEQFVIWEAGGTIGKFIIRKTREGYKTEVVLFLVSHEPDHITLYTPPVAQK